MVEENASFLVDLNQLDHVDDIKADDCGHWIHNGRKTTKVAVWISKGTVTKVVATIKISKVHQMKTANYIHLFVYTMFTTLTVISSELIIFMVSCNFLKQSVNLHFIADDQRVCQDHCLVCYTFDNEPHSIKPRTHGNSKSDRAYVRTMRSTVEKMSSSKSTSIKETLTEVIDSVGGWLTLEVLVHFLKVFSK